MLRQRAHDMLAQGIKQYEAGDFDNAQRNLQGVVNRTSYWFQEEGLILHGIQATECAAIAETTCRSRLSAAHPTNVIRCS